MNLPLFLIAKSVLLCFGIVTGFFLPEQDHLILCVFFILAASFSAYLPQSRVLQALPLFFGCMLPLLFPEAVGLCVLLVFDAVTLGVYPAVFPLFFFLAWNRPEPVLFGLFLCGVLLSALLAYALKERTDLQKALSSTKDSADETALIHREEQLAQAKLQDAEVAAATLSERNRIAREIHDNVGHMLSRAILQTGAVKAVKKDDPALSAQLSVLEDSLNEAMNRIRESVHNLYDDSVDLEQAARSLTDDFSFCPVTLSCRISSPVPRDITYCLLAVLKEALVNISRHSSATEAQVTITEHPAIWQMVIQDNGTGSDPPKDKSDNGLPSAESGLGLNSMRTRVEQLSGTIRFSSGDGFRIFVSIPKENT